MDLEKLIERSGVERAQLKIIMCAIGLKSDQACKNILSTITTPADLVGGEFHRAEILEPPDTP